MLWLSMEVLYRNSVYAVLSTCITPLLLTALTWGLYKLGSVFLKYFTPEKEEKKEANKKSNNIALHIHVESNKLAHLLERPEAQMEEGMAGTAPGGAGVAAV